MVSLFSLEFGLGMLFLGCSELEVSGGRYFSDVDCWSGTVVFSMVKQLGFAHTSVNHACSVALATSAASRLD